jgi:hypothetical protein
MIEVENKKARRAYALTGTLGPVGHGGQYTASRARHTVWAINLGQRPHGTYQNSQHRNATVEQLRATFQSMTVQRSIPQHSTRHARSDETHAAAAQPTTQLRTPQPAQPAPHDQRQHSRDGQQHRPQLQHPAHSTFAVQQRSSRRRAARRTTAKWYQQQSRPASQTPTRGPMNRPQHRSMDAQLHRINKVSSSSAASARVRSAKREFKRIQLVGSQGLSSSLLQSHSQQQCGTRTMEHV